MSEVPVRIVSWNLCDGFTRKFGHLERLRPDVAFLQEVRPDCLAYAGLSGSSLWLGDPGQKGMAIVSYGDWALSPAPKVLADRWFLPAVARGPVGEELLVVNVWAESTADCPAATGRAIDALEEDLAGRPSVMAGDFNQSVGLKGRNGGKRFAAIVERLEALGLRSAWHEHHREIHGEETAATHFHTWNVDRPFHIDFAFCSDELGVTAVELGRFEHYGPTRISDHMPLVVDFDYATAPRGQGGGVPAS